MIAAGDRTYLAILERRGMPPTEGVYLRRPEVNKAFTFYPVPPLSANQVIILPPLLTVVKKTDGIYMDTASGVQYVLREAVDQLRFNEQVARLRKRIVEAERKRNNEQTKRLYRLTTKKK